MPISSLAMARYAERHTAPLEAGSQNALAAFPDNRIPEERMERIYPMPN